MVKLCTVSIQYFNHLLVVIKKERCECSIGFHIFSVDKEQNRLFIHASIEYE